MKDVIIVLRVRLRHDVSRPRLNQMVEEAVESWGGSLHPDDPLFSAVEFAEAKTLKWNK